MSLKILIKKLLYPLDKFGLLIPIIYIFKSFCNDYKFSINHLKKEFSYTKKKNVFEANKVILFGLPKSGTTYISKIYRYSGYIDFMNSFFIRRSYPETRREYPHYIDENLFRFLPKNKDLFARFHSEYNHELINFLRSNNYQIFVTIRDIRDMLLSRYFHISYDKTHWLHSRISKLEISEGFFQSILPHNNFDPLSYYSNWINDYIESDIYLIKYEDLTFNNQDLILLKNISTNLTYPETTQLTNFDRSINNFGIQKDTFRSGKKGEWQKYFNEKIKDLIKMKCSKILIKSKYEKDDKW